MEYGKFKETVIAFRNDDRRAHGFFEKLEASENAAIYSPSAGLAVFCDEWSGGRVTVDQAYITPEDMSGWVEGRKQVGEPWTAELLANCTAVRTSDLARMESTEDPEWQALVASVLGICLLPDWTDNPEAVA